MDIDRTHPNQTIVRERPLFVPGFCLMFLIIGVANLVLGFLHDDWDRNKIFGIAVCILLGGGLFLYSARRCEYRFHSRRRELRWIQRNLLGTRTGVIPFDDIERVVMHRGSDDSLYRVVIYTPDGQFPLSNAYTSNQAMHREVRDTIRKILEESAAPV